MIFVKKKKKFCIFLLNGKFIFVYISLKTFNIPCTSYVHLFPKSKRRNGTKNVFIFLIITTVHFFLPQWIFIYEIWRAAPFLK